MLAIDDVMSHPAHAHVEPSWFGPMAAAVELNSKSPAVQRREGRAFGGPTRFRFVKCIGPSTGGPPAAWRGVGFAPVALSQQRCDAAAGGRGLAWRAGGPPLEDPTPASGPALGLVRGPATPGVPVAPPCQPNSQITSGAGGIVAPTNADPSAHASCKTNSWKVQTASGAGGKAASSRPPPEESRQTNGPRHMQACRRAAPLPSSSFGIPQLKRCSKVAEQEFGGSGLTIAYSPCVFPMQTRTTATCCATPACCRPPCCTCRPPPLAATTVTQQIQCRRHTRRPCASRPAP
jgi:hypothetical protein